MDDLTLALRQHSQAFHPADGAFQRVVQRGNRRQRARRMGSAAVALALFAIVDFGLLRGLSPTHSSPTPADRTMVPAPHPVPSTTVPGRPTFVDVRPTGRTPHVAHDISDISEANRSGAAGSIGARAGVTGEDTTPRPTITQDPLLTGGTQAGDARTGAQAGGQTNGDGNSKCAVLPTKSARARCLNPSRFHRSPKIQIVGPLDPTIVVTSPEEPGTEPGTNDPTTTEAPDGSSASDPAGGEEEAPAPAADQAGDAQAEAAPALEAP
jgi:hypothetical protein